MIALLHGYFLDGSGSGVWTRQIIDALCRQGEDVLLICQDPHFEKYPFVAQAFTYDRQGNRTLALDRPTPFAGKTHLHKINVGPRLPVFVDDTYEGFLSTVPVIQMSEADWEDYIEAHLKVLPALVQEYGIDCLIVNHAALLSVVAQRLQVRIGLPYAVIPHGSDLEYAIRRDPRLHTRTESALEAAAKIFVVSPEIAERLKEVFPNKPNLHGKIERLSIGVDTAQFAPILPKDRASAFGDVARRLKMLPVGKNAANDRPPSSMLSELPKLARYQGWLQGCGAYETKRIETSAVSELHKVAWGADPVAAFVGRFIAAKGLQSLIAALPLLWRNTPNLRVMAVGHGPLREVAAVLIEALRTGNVPWAEAIAQWGSPLEGEPGTRYFGVGAFFQALKRTNQWDDYWRAAVNMPADRIHFVGYLDHDLLCRLLPLSDCALFPSVVPEAGPMVLIEAASCGSFPLGTNQAGMAHNLSELFEKTPAPWIAAARLPVDPAAAPFAIATQIPQALSYSRASGTTLRANCVRKYDWSSLATHLLTSLSATRRTKAA